MAVTLAIFAALQLSMPLWIRPHLFPPARTVTTIASISDIGFQNRTQSAFAITADALSGQPGAWIISSGAVNAAGQPTGTVPAACVRAAASSEGTGLDCLAGHGIRVAVTYQPVGRYWAFEWTETAIYLALALALTGYCYWRLARSLS